MKAKESHQLKFGVRKSDHLRKDITKPRTRQGLGVQATTHPRIIKDVRTH